MCYSRVLTGTSSTSQPSQPVVPQTSASEKVVVLSLPHEAVNRRVFLRAVGGVAIAAVTAPLLLPQPALAQEPVPQRDWRYCHKCNSLFFDGFVEKGKCPAGGGHEAAGFNFILPYDVDVPGQKEWRSCDKCRTLFFNGGPFKGRCPNGGTHVPLGFHYVLPHGTAAIGQRGWRYCSQCAGLFFNDAGIKGPCPAGGRHTAAGLNFTLNYQRDPRTLPPKLEFDTRQIGFPGGVPVGGWSNLTLFADGNFHFKGHFHVSGAPSYNVGMAWMIRSAAGQGLAFARRGELHGTFSSGSRDFDWDITGRNHHIRLNWADLALGSRVEWKAKVNMDIGSILSEVRQALDPAGPITKLIEVVAP